MPKADDAAAPKLVPVDVEARPHTSMIPVINQDAILAFIKRKREEDRAAGWKDATFATPSPYLSPDAWMPSYGGQYIRWRVGRGGRIFLDRCLAGPRRTGHYLGSPVPSESPSDDDEGKRTNPAAMDLDLDLDMGMDMSPHHSAALGYSQDSGDESWFHPDASMDVMCVDGDLQ